MWCISVFRNTHVLYVMLLCFPGFLLFNNIDFVGILNTSLPLRTLGSIGVVHQICGSSQSNNPLQPAMQASNWWESHVGIHLSRHVLTSLLPEATQAPLLMLFALSVLLEPA